MEYMEFLETLLNYFVSLAILLFEYIGVGVITYSGIQGLINCLTRKPDTRLRLAKGLAMGLEFNLGSEILRTVVLRSLNELYIVAGIIALRAVLTLLIHWEIKNEEQDDSRLKKLEREETAAAPAPSKESEEKTAFKEASGSWPDQKHEAGAAPESGTAGIPASRTEEASGHTPVPEDSDGRKDGTEPKNAREQAAKSEPNHTKEQAAESKPNHTTEQVKESEPNTTTEQTAESNPADVTHSEDGTDSEPAAELASKTKETKPAPGHSEPTAEQLEDAAEIERSLMADERSFPK